MPRGNIFKAKELTLDYDGSSFILKKNKNPSGSKYDTRGAYNLLITIQEEMKKPEHEIEYNLKKLNIDPRTEAEIENYKRSLEEKVTINENGR